MINYDYTIIYNILSRLKTIIKGNYVKPVMSEILSQYIFCGKRTNSRILAGLKNTSYVFLGRWM